MQPLKPSDLFGVALAKTDGQLLARFIQNQDESAFEDLVKRHATMVMAACRMILENVRDAEEAFQNTFMVLAGKAHQHTGKKSINGWLYRVAVWKALNIRSKRSVQARHIVEQKDAEMIAEQEPGSAVALESIKGLLAEELNRLADKYSLPLILCYLEGKSAEQAAHDLGLSNSTLKVRLMRGRELLRKRLVRRGVVVSAGLLSTVLMEQVAQSAEVVSEVLIQSTVKAATALLSAAAGTAAITAASKLTILKGMVMDMIYSKTALVIGGLALVSVPVLILGNIHKNKSPQPSANIIHSIKDGGVSNQVAVSATNAPTSLTEAVKSVPDKNVSASNSTNLLPVASARDFLLCLKFASELLDSDPKECWQILRRLGINLSDDEFDTAWNTYLKEHPRAASHDNFCLQVAIFDTWLKKDPCSAVNLIYRLSKLPEQDVTTAQAILNDNGLYSVASNAESIPFFAMSDEMIIDKDGKYNYQGQGPGGTIVAFPDTKPFLSFFLKRWAVQDYQAALAWAKDLSDDKERQSMIEVVELGRTIRTALSNTNPKEGLDTLFSIEKEFQKSKNYRCSLNPEARAIGAKWAESDLNAALDWASSQTGRTAAVLCAQEKIYETWTKNDFPVVLALITQSAKYYPGIDMAEQKIAETWGEADQQSALDWMEQVLSNQETYDKSRKDLARVILDRWSYGDPEGAATWWLQKYQCVKTEDDRRSLDKIISNWKKIDPESADQWVQTSLSPAMRDSLDRQHQRDKNLMIAISDETARGKYQNFMKDKKNAEKVKDEAFMDKFADDLLKEIRERSGKAPVTF